MLKTETILEPKHFPICANFDCTNRLTEYELNRNRRELRNKFCRKCRVKMDRITRIRCLKCGILIYCGSHKTVCVSCQTGRKREVQNISGMVRYYRKRIKEVRTEKPQTELTEITLLHLQQKLEFFQKELKKLVE